MDDQNKNLIIASVLSFIVIVVWFLLFPPADQVQPTTPDAVTQQVEGVLPRRQPNLAPRRASLPEHPRRLRRRPRRGWRSRRPASRAASRW